MTIYEYLDSLAFIIILSFEFLSTYTFILFIRLSSLG